MRILLVEDDRELRQTLRDALAVEGHALRCAASLADARAQWQHAEQTDPTQRPDLILLDLGLPDGEGAELLTLIRQQRQVPVIVLSARADEPGKIALLDAGADDYLVKPFSIGELLARMRVAWRHRGRAAWPALTRYEREGLCIDLTAHSVRLHAVDLHLTPTEFRLLARLVRSAGQVVTHRQLLGDVWGAEHVDSTHYLRLYMGQLRAKLEPVPAEPRWLLTEVGVGYRLVEPEILMRS